MNSGRLFRAVLTGIVLLVCIWGLKGLRKQVYAPVALPGDSPRLQTAEQAGDQSGLTPAVQVATLPLVALDNTCFQGLGEDLSRCTGNLSGAPAREYRVAAVEGKSLYIGAVPRSEYFDLSFAVFDADENCVAGVDDHSAGLPEQRRLDGLKPGEYRLVVGGYAEDCGPYELTVRADEPVIAQVVETHLLRGSNGTVVRWGTFAEVDLKFFAVYRTDGIERERVAILRGRGSPAGFARYRIIDRQHRPDSTYEIEAVARDGRIELLNVGA